MRLSHSKGPMFKSIYYGFEIWQFNLVNTIFQCFSNALINTIVPFCLEPAMGSRVINRTLGNGKHIGLLELPTYMCSGLDLKRTCVHSINCCQTPALIEE